MKVTLEDIKGMSQNESEKYQKIKLEMKLQISFMKLGFQPTSKDICT